MLAGTSSLGYLWVVIADFMLTGDDEGLIDVQGGGGLVFEVVLEGEPGRRLGGRDDVVEFPRQLLSQH